MPGCRFWLVLDGRRPRVGGTAERAAWQEQAVPRVRPSETNAANPGVDLGGVRGGCGAWPAPGTTKVSQRPVTWAREYNRVDLPARRAVWILAALDDEPPAR